MELLIVLVVIVIVFWIWRTRKYDRLTTSDFDIWLERYETSSNPLERSGMAVAFLAQSIHLAWSLSAINGKQKDLVTSILKQQQATVTMSRWLNSFLPTVIRVIGADEAANSPARTIGMLMLIGWMADTDPEHAIRRFCFSDKKY